MGALVLVAACGTPESATNSGSAPAAQPAAATGAQAGAGPSAASSPSPAAGIAAVKENIKENKVLRLGVTEAGFGPAGRTAPPGLRYYTVGLRGTSKSDSAHAVLGQIKGNDVQVDVRRFVYAQNDRGCISRPERVMTELDRPIGDSIIFPAMVNKSGQLAFLVPAETERVRVLIAPGGEDGLVVPVGEDFTPSWPKPVQTIDDGTTMRVHVLPLASTPSNLPAPAAGRELVALDVAIENLKTDGIEFQTSMQLRLIGATGSFVQPNAELTRLVGCRLDDNDVIPPGHVRRLMAIFDMPAGSPVRLQYRGFEREEALVSIR